MAFSPNSPYLSLGSHLEIWLGRSKGFKVDLLLRKFMIFEKSIPLCSPASLQLYYVDQAGLKVIDPPASASPVLGSKA